MLKFLSLYFFHCGLSLLQDVWASAGRLKGWGQKWSGGSLIHTSGVHTSAGWCQLLAKMSARGVGWTPTCGLFVWYELPHNGESGFWGPVTQLSTDATSLCSWWGRLEQSHGPDVTQAWKVQTRAREKLDRDKEHPQSAPLPSPPGPVLQSGTALRPCCTFNRRETMTVGFAP